MSSVSTVAIQRYKDHQPTTSAKKYTKTNTNTNTNPNSSCLLSLKRREQEDGDESHKGLDSQQVDEEDDAKSVTSSSHQIFGSWREHEPLVPTSHTEFFDADDEFLSDGSVSNASPSFRRKIEVEMHATRANLFDEIEKGKRVENDLARLRSQWQRIKNRLSQVGLSFPVAQDASRDPELHMDSVQQLCQEIVVARFVSEAVGRGQARAETEAAAELMIDTKDQEINRLRNKVNYYEAVNHEMSRRNQELVDVAQKQGLTRKTKKRWAWACIGLSVSLGAVTIAYSLFSETNQHIHSESSDAASDMPGPV